MHGLSGRLYSLAELAGRPIVTAALAFAIYVLGDIMKLSADQLSVLNRSPHLSPANYFDLRHFARSAFSTGFATPRATNCRRDKGKWSATVAVAVHSRHQGCAYR
jgi:hypothetical protein